jgi:predicted transposase/invertase (TIGR01784 family)
MTEREHERKNRNNQELPLLPLKSDLIFKMVFGDHRNVDILRAFLVAALKMPDEEFETIEILNPYLELDHPNEKLGILDVRLRTKQGKRLIIEIQCRGVLCMQERVTFYTGKNLTSQITSGQAYEELRKTITIAILDYNLLPDGARYHHKFKLYDPVNDTLFTDVIEIHTLELLKLPHGQNANAKEEELLNWLRLIKAEKKEEVEMLATKSPEMRKTVGILKKLSADERTRMLYEAREMAERDELSRIEGARAEGEAENMLNVARAMLDENMTLEQIAKITKLPIEEIEALRP